MSSREKHMWVTPILLLFIIAGIYLISLLPNPSSHRDASVDITLDEYAQWSDQWRKNMAGDGMIWLSPCFNNGIYNETEESCRCLKGFWGEKCQNIHRRICMNNGFYVLKHRRCQCPPSFTGERCELRCIRGFVNNHTAECDCFPPYFGSKCDFICLHGEIHNGSCVCEKGYHGFSCGICDIALVESGECLTNQRRQNTVNSRLTMSGLLFFVLIVALLCLTTRKRIEQERSGSDTWNRIFQATNRPIMRSRQYANINEYSNRIQDSFERVVDEQFRRTIERQREIRARCEMLPRIITARLPVNFIPPSSLEINTTEGPPPTYTSVDNLADEPPTYEEATRSSPVEESIEENQNETEDTEKDITA